MTDHPEVVVLSVRWLAHGMEIELTRGCGDNETGRQERQWAHELAESLVALVEHCLIEHDARTCHTALDLEERFEAAVRQIWVP